MFSAYLLIFALTDELGHSMRRPAAPSAVLQLEYSRWQCNIADLNRNRSQTALNKIQDLFCNHWIKCVNKEFYETQNLNRWKKGFSEMVLLQFSFSNES